MLQVRLCGKKLVAPLLTMILDKEVAKRSLIHLVHPSGNPRACIIALKKAQFSESNTLAKSNFRKIAFSFVNVICCSITRVTRKYFEICLPHTNAVWYGETKTDRYIVNLKAKSLEIILGTIFIMLMGQKSLTSFAEICNMSFPQLHPFFCKCYML